MRTILRLFPLVIATLLWPATALGRLVSQIDWPNFHPDARAVLALDRARPPVHVLTDRCSRFRAYVGRLLEHDLFVSGKFDPGWRTA